ncbi:hypothetical protein LTR36_004603 [Oleoguttula mirabilis]|uniref:Glutathione transferase n=1 Tax=Oleoguttula mirabilis TaxID=1507867 RepID=A0AAV9JFL6_9PEZI|nr:hypothetical protein LTR36_004603 [Oleoguttula mirabilis]
MSSLLTTLGLRSSGPFTQPPSQAAGYLIFHFLFAYGVLSSRMLKLYYGIDHNVSPREDLTKYGQKAVENGKITQIQLNRLKRIESAHANSVEHFPLFVGAMIWAQVAGLPTSEINASALVYTVARVAYATVYILVYTPRMSQLRGICWWASNITCLRLFWLGGTAVNSKL